MKVCIVNLILATALLDAEAVPLFNGTDLTGWKGDGYRVEKGELICTPVGRTLVTEKEYSDYVLEFDFKLPPGGNNGLGIHYPGHGLPSATGVEVQILDDTDTKYKTLKDSQFHGSLYLLQASKQGHLKPVGQWNHQKVTIYGDQVTVELNGTVITDANLSELEQAHPQHRGVKRRNGHITFCGHGDRVALKNIDIEVIDPPLLPEAPADEVAAEDSGFEKIYNAKDLAGWSHAPDDLKHWQPRGEVLHYDGKSQAVEKNLWSEKEYGDFTLYCDWRWVGPSGVIVKHPELDPTTGDAKLGEDGLPIMIEVDELDSGIYLRGNSTSQVNLWNWPCGSGEVYGYRVNSNLPQHIRAALTPKQKADKPIGEWNRMQITMLGDRVTVVLNGQTVIENAQLPGVPQAGKIALQHHGSVVEFANLFIKEHTPEAANPE